ncbi:MAG: hypothetical protein FWG10_06855 [Eubacteriaceae bacterium]|nr:hypothetical protein [Eubacteriaceae bacterium]
MGKRKKNTYGITVLCLLALLRTAIFGIGGWAVLGAAPKANINQVLVNGLASLAYSIDVSQFRLSQDEFNDVYADMSYSSPQLFYVVREWKMSYSSDGIVRTVYPKYTDSGDKAIITAKKAALELAVDVAMSQMPINGTDAEKVLAAHDYIVANTSYDLPTLNVMDLEDGKYSAYDALVGRSAVCEGYSLAFGLLMDRLGIEWKMILSEGMGHSWNLAKVDGNWFHLDLTWDDPVISLTSQDPDYWGSVSHEYLLLSDSELVSRSHGEELHYGWDSGGIVCDTSIPQRFWSGVNGRMAYKDGYWYYLKRANSGSAQIVRASYHAAHEMVVASFTSSSPRLAQCGQLLIYNTNNEVYAIKHDGSEKTLLGTVAGMASNERVYDLAVIDGNAVARTRASSDLTKAAKTVAFPIPGAEEALKALVYIVSNKIVTGVEAGTTVEQFLSGFENSARIIANHGPGSLVATGTVVQAASDTGAECVVVIYGDCHESYLGTGDGLVDQADFIAMAAFAISKGGSGPLYEAAKPACCVFGAIWEAGCACIWHAVM